MDEPQIRVHDRVKDPYELLEDWCYDWSVDGLPSQRLMVAAGFRFDMASVPKAAHSLIGPLDLGLAPPLCHDALYRCRGHTDKSEWVAHLAYVDDLWHLLKGFPWSRVDADRLFGRHMREVGVGKWRRRAAYLAVRVGGRRNWK